MIKSVIFVVAGCSLFGSTLVVAQCPPNLNAEEVISCIVAEGAGETYVGARAVEVSAQVVPGATSQIIDQASADNGSKKPSQGSY